jgi:ABC-type polysaccharide/polyol phosphate export permease
MCTTFRELFAYRALIHTLVMRDLKARYRAPCWDCSGPC